MASCTSSGPSNALRLVSGNSPKTFTRTATPPQISIGSRPLHRHAMDRFGSSGAPLMWNVTHAAMRHVGGVQRAFATSGCRR